MHIHIHKHTYEWKTKFRAEMRMRSKCARIAAKTRHGEGHAQLGFKMSFVSLFMQKRPTKETRLYRGSLLWVPFTPLLREQSCQVFMGSKDAPQKMQVLRTIKKLASLFRGYKTQSGGKSPQIRLSLNQNMFESQCSCIFQEPLNKGKYAYTGLSVKYGLRESQICIYGFIRKIWLIAVNPACWCQDAGSPEALQLGCCSGKR